MEKIRLFVIAGPTACGKTDVSIQLAKMIDGEIISADSMQVYKYMNIGTAKATAEEMQGIKHYLIDELYPDEEYSVAVFQKFAKECISEITQKGKTPILAGGTGFYINALLHDNDFTETKKDETYRQHLFDLALTHGNEYVHNMLGAIDPKAAESIHCNNIKRTVRALEFFQQTGQMISLHNETEKDRDIKYDAKIAILNMDRSILYQRINTRVDKMIAKGLVQEVEELLEMGYSPELVSMQGLGYKEIVKYLNGESSLDQAIYDIKIGTRHFAKRQLTWFKRQIIGKWFDVLSFESAYDLAKSIATSFS